MSSSWKKNRNLIIVIVIIVVSGASATSGLYLLAKGTTPPSRPLPPGCVQPSGGFLIVASNLGFNDSIEHGAGQVGKSWPVINVHQGQNVTITVCNVDVQPHGFQVTHYYDVDKQLVTLVPGQVLSISFDADQVGAFSIFCAIFCTIHPYMQSGLLNVSAT